MFEREHGTADPGLAKRVQGQPVRVGDQPLDGGAHRRERGQCGAQRVARERHFVALCLFD